MGNAVENQRETTEDATEKQARALQTLNTDQKLKSIGDLFSKKILTAEAKDELEKYIKDRTRDDLISRTGNKKKSKSYVFQKFKAIRSFGRHNYGGVIMLNDAFEEQINPKN